MQSARLITWHTENAQKILIDTITFGTHLNDLSVFLILELELELVE